MKLNGARKPRGGPQIGCSIGAKKYRDKQFKNFKQLSINNITDKIPEPEQITKNGRTNKSSKNQHKHKSTSKSIASITANFQNNFIDKCYSKGTTNMAMRYQQSSSSLLALNFRFMDFSNLNPFVALNSLNFTANSFVIYITFATILLLQPSLIECQDDHFFVSSFSGPETSTPEFGE